MIAKLTNDDATREPIADRALMVVLGLLTIFGTDSLAVTVVSTVLAVIAYAMNHQTHRDLDTHRHLCRSDG